VTSSATTPERSTIQPHQATPGPQHQKSLPRPLLEVLTQGFRKRFSIPEEATTIADRILHKQHHDWIEAFLVQHQAAA